MTAEAITLVHQLSTLATAWNHLRKAADAVSDDAIHHILDFHFERKATWLRHLETANWLWLHSSFRQTAEAWTAELPLDIADHRVSRIDLEEKALRICILQRLTEIAHQRAQSSD
jgi:hypothetical protein